MDLTVQEPNHLFPASWILDESFVALQLSKDIILNVCNVEMISNVAQELLPRLSVADSGLREAGHACRSIGLGKREVLDALLQRQVQVALGKLILRLCGAQVIVVVSVVAP